MNDTKLSFSEIRQQAGCAWKLRKLGRQLAIDHPCDPQGPLGHYDAPDYSRQGETLRAIEIVLKLIAEAPNAYVNRDALDAMQREVQLGIAMTKQDWIEEVLGRPEGDEIPF